MRKNRHWLRGILGGILLGLALGLGSIIYGFNAFGAITPWVMVIIGIVIGVAMVFVPSRRGLRAQREGPPPARTY